MTYLVKEILLNCQARKPRPLSQYRNWFVLSSSTKPALTLSIFVSVLGLGSGIVMMMWDILMVTGSVWIYFYQIKSILRRRKTKARYAPGKWRFKGYFSGDIWQVHLKEKTKNADLTFHPFSPHEESILIMLSFYIVTHVSSFFHLSVGVTSSQLK